MTLPELRPYQVEAHEQLRARAMHWAQVKRGWGLLLVAPTSFGKTRTGLELAMAVVDKGRRALWLAGRTETIDQPADRLRAAGVDVSIVKADREEGTGPIVVASVQTVLARGLADADFGLVILDEARHFVAPEWKTVPERLLHIPRIGLDATPAQRGQAGGVGLDFLFDEIIVGASMERLRRDGWILPARHIAEDREKAKTNKNLWAEPLDAYLKHAPGTSVLGFCSSRLHAKVTAQVFNDAGISSMAVDANTPADVRKRAVDALRSGELQAIFNVQIFTEGFDCPAVQTIMIARRVQEVWTLMQMGGRGLRPANGRAIPGEECIVLDLFSSCHRVDPNSYFIGEERVWSLEGEACRPPAEKLPTAVQCRKCHGWSRGGGKCPTCGAIKPPPPLPKVTKRQAREQIREARLKAIPCVGAKWDRWCEIVRLKRSRNWKPNAARIWFKKQYGQWPPWVEEQVDARHECRRR